MSGAAAFSVFLFSGLVLVTLIDAVGSLLSRRLNINYGYFSILSFFVYTGLAYLLVQKIDNIFYTLICLILIGTYDGSVGWAIAKKFNSNNGPHSETIQKLNTFQTIAMANLFAVVSGGFGIILAK